MDAELTVLCAVDMSSSNTSYTWKAENMNIANMGNKIYFSIQNANDITCNGCVAKTQAFYVTDKRPIMSGSASPSASVAAASSPAGVAPSQTEISQTGAGASTAASGQPTTQTTEAAAAAGQQNSRPKPEGKSSSNAVGLGVGLGIGLAVLIALIVLLLVCLRRRRRKREPSFSYHPTGSGNWTQSDDSPRPEVREVTPKYTSGLTETTAVGDFAEPKFRESGSSSVSNPFRPATPASGLSHTSWIEPFEFERPESRAQDAMSQLRQSTLIDDVDGGNAIVAAPAAAALAPPTVDDDAASSKYSMQEETFGPESPSDAAVVRSPSSAVGPFSHSSNRNSSGFQYAGIGPDSSPYRTPLERPEPVYAYPPSQADGRNWPFP